MEEIIHVEPILILLLVTYMSCIKARPIKYVVAWLQFLGKQKKGLIKLGGAYVQ